MSASTIIVFVSSLIGKILLFYIVGLGALASLVAVVQESKIWKPKTVPSLSWLGGVKVFVFNFLWIILCAIGSMIISIRWCVTLGNSNLGHDCNLHVESIVGRAVIRLLVGRVHVIGSLPATINSVIPAPVLVANHSSQIDTGLPYFIGRFRFKWIVKKSIYYLPGVGQVIYLGDHVAIDRRTGKNQASVSTLFDKSNKSVQEGIPMFIFPQGTRRIAEKLPFKNGAFVIAKTNRSPIIPVSIDIPRNVWNSTYPLNLLWGGERPEVVITIHQPIPVLGDEDVDGLKKRCLDQIYSVLPDTEGSKEK